ncbi:MAG: hypothetical protein C4316_10635, partial [Chloroflexota bacterium]
TTASVPLFGKSNAIPVTWTATNPSTGPATTVVCFWARKATTPPLAWKNVGSPVTGPGPNETFSGTDTVTVSGVTDGDKVEILVTLHDTSCPTTVPPAPNDATPAQASTIIDTKAPIGYVATGPRGPAPITSPETGALFCNTSELFGVARDNPGGSPLAADWAGMKDITFAAAGGVVLLGGLGEVDAQATQGPVFKMVTRRLTVPSDAISIKVDAQASDFAGNKQPASPVTIVDRPSLTSDSSDVAPCKSFTDVAGHWAEVYIRYLGSAGLIAGFPDGSYKPDAPVLRAQLAKLLVASLGYGPGDLPPVPTSPGCNFTDVSDSAWYAGWVRKACHLEIMVGVGGGKFAPQDPVTRAQAVTAIWRLKDQSDKSSTTGFVDESVLKNELVTAANRTLRGAPPFTDVVAFSYYEQAVTDLYNIGVVDGTTSTTFSPDAPVTRGQVAKLLYRALGRWFELK